MDSLFGQWRIQPWVWRLITRALAILPAVFIIRGDSSVADLLTLSQVVLALQLPFAMFPLLHFTATRVQHSLSVPVLLLRAK